MNPMEQHLLMLEMEDTLHQAERALKKAVRAINYKDTIIIGNLDEPLYTFGDGDLESLSLVNGVDVVGAELSVDQLTPTVVYISKTVLQLWAPKGYKGLKCSDGRLFVYRVPRLDLRKLPYGTPVWYFRNDALVGKYYSLNVDRVAKVFYQINAVSAVGILGKTQHMGGIYKGETFETVVTEIIGGLVPFRCDPDVAALKIYNWLPIASRRANLHQLLFAYGVSVLRDENGDMLFNYLGAGEPKAVPDGRIYYGGSVDYSTSATGVEVTEHSYSPLPNVEAVTLFDNTDTSVGANNTFVPFDQAPVFDLEVSGNLQIVDSGANWAIVTGVGVLTGKPYTHTSRVISLSVPNADQHEANVVRVTDATLVNLTNSHNVAQRILDYYSSAKTISAAISLEGESAGDQVALSDPFGEASVGFLERLEINVSSNLKANCTIVTDYVPHHERPNFTHVEVLTGEGDYIVPEGVHLIRAAIIQAGTGGGRGYNGKKPKSTKVDSWSRTVSNMTTYYAAQWAAEGGDGGEAGVRGEGGKIYVVDIPVTPGQVIHFKAGSPGQGAALDAIAGEPGQEGGESVFGEYSSVTGARTPFGWVDELSGKVYAKPGRQGVKGGKGSGAKTTSTTHPIWGLQHETVEVPGETIEVDGVTYTPGASYIEEEDRADSSGSWNAGYGSFSYGCFGSFGGGPAYGSNGNDGYHASANGYYRRGNVAGQGYITYGAVSNGRVGGKGADARPFPAASAIGEGGAAGNGGGGAGATGTPFAINNVAKQGATHGGTLTINNFVADGGSGSEGSPGGPGGILVYYGDPATETAAEEETV